MGETKFFHCKLQIRRCGKHYNLGKKYFKSTLRQFFRENETLSFSIGSDKDNTICIKKLAPKHIDCKCTKDSFLITAHAPIKILFDEEKHELGANEELKRDFNQEAQSFSFDWKISFPNKARVVGKIWQQEETLSKEAINHLKQKYGAIKQIQIGKTCLIYQAEENKILKILRPSYAKKTGLVTRYVNAARKFYLLPKNFFLKIDKIIYLADIPLCYVVMESFVASSLESIQAQQGLIATDQAISIAEKLTQQLAILQHQGYSCRYLNPGNILVANDGSVRITSFFLMKTDTNMTAHGERMVIANYTAPEQIESASKADIYADMFSLGSILYEMLAGSPPFDSNNTARYMAFLATSESITEQEITENIPNISEDLCKIIASLLSFDKKKRPAPEKLLNLLFQNGDSQAENASERGPEALTEDLLDAIDNVCQDKKTNSISDSLMTAIDLYDGKEQNSKLRQIQDSSGQFSERFIRLLQIVEDTFEQENKRQSYSIVIIDTPGKPQQQEYNFTGDKTVVIGQEGDFCITNDPKIAKEHVKIEIEKGSYKLINMTHEQETYIDGKPIAIQEIAPNTDFRIGETILLFQKCSIQPAKTEISQKEISSLKMLEISGMQSVTNPATNKVEMLASQEQDIESSNQRLQDAYQKVEMLKSEKTEDTQKALPTKKNQNKTLTVVFTILIVFQVIFMAQNAFSAKKTTQTGQKPSSQPKTVKSSKKTLSISGKITIIAKSDTNLDYFVVKTLVSKKQYAVRPISSFSRACIELIKNAKEAKKVVTISGEQKKLSKGIIFLEEQRTKDYLELRDIECGKTYLKFDE